MPKIFIKWIALTLAIIASAAICSAIGLNFHAKTGSAADIVELFIGAAVFAIINATLGGLLKLISAPLNCLTLGLLGLVINAIMLGVAGSLHYGFTVGDFPAAFVGSILISALNAVISGLLIRDKSKEDE